MRGVQTAYGPHRRDRSGSRSRPFQGNVVSNSGLVNSRDSDFQSSRQNSRLESEESSILAKTDVHP
eukprot:1459811-Alexandrium_andersonii.AAC.1